MHAATRSARESRRAARSTRREARPGTPPGRPIEQQPAIGRQQVGEPARSSSATAGHTRGRGFERVDPDHVDVQLRRPLQQGVDRGLAVGEQGQERAEHHGGLEARSAGRLDHPQPLLDAGRARLPEFSQALVQRGQRDADAHAPRPQKCRDP